ncbi:MAG: glycosyltransferase family 4 protein [Candidatus Omnitrophica bacterium]|nr:glycosyltransferase family 4 protein [Candidatus Omnitrophota bacterium]
MSTRQKVLLITFEYPTGKAYCGGVGQIVKQCREALLGLGYEVYVLISSEFRKKYPVKLLHSDGSLARFSNFRAFQKQYDWHAFNYIVQHFVNWTKELKKLKNHKGTRPKIVYHFHSILRREKDSGFKTLNHFLFNQERMIEIADKIICPSRYEYENFSRYFPSFLNKVVLIENTMETFSRQDEEIGNIKAQYGIKDGDIVSIYVGRLEKIKGAHTLIQHLPHILNRYKHLKIFIIGKSLERNLYKKLMKMQKRFSRQLFYIRYIEKRRLFQYYYLSSIYVNTSLSESFSLATHESAFCNNGLLLNRLPVFDKFKDAALFFSNHDSNDNDFIPRYEELIRNNRLRDKLAKKATEIAKDYLPKSKIKKEFQSFLKNSLK